MLCIIIIIIIENHECIFVYLFVSHFAGVSYWFIGLYCLL